MTDHDVGMLHADIQRLREQIQAWVRWGIGLIAAVVIGAIFSAGVTVARLEHVEMQAREAREVASDTEARVRRLESARDVTSERLSALTESVKALAREVREMLDRDRNDPRRNP